jgi:hypothetical protein
MFLGIFDVSQPSYNLSKKSVNGGTSDDRPLRILASLTILSAKVDLSSGFPGTIRQ